jgi:hypothetical protein
MPVLFCLPSSSCPVMNVLSFLSCPGCLILSALSWQPCSASLAAHGCPVSFPVLPVLFSLFYFACHVLLSSPACPVLPVLSGCPILSVLPWLSYTSSHVLAALCWQSSAFSPVLRSCAGSPVLAVRCWQSCAGSPVLTVPFLFCLSCSAGFVCLSSSVYPVLPCPVRPVLSTCPVLVVLSFRSCPGCLMLTVMLCQPCLGSFVWAVLGMWTNGSMAIGLTKILYIRLSILSIKKKKSFTGMDRYCRWST